MASPKRDLHNPGAGKLLDSSDVVFDLTAFYKKMDGVLDAVTGLKVDAVIETGDIEIGAVELKDATSSDRANISAANTARAASDKVLLVQNIGADGSVGSGGSAANTARTTATVVSPTQTVDQAGTVAANITAGADGVSNTGTRLGVSSWLKAFNGTTWDRLRSGLTTLSATLTGILNTLPWAIYNATPTSRTEGQGGPLQADVKGSLNVNLATKLSGEDQTNDVLKVEQQFAYNNIVTQTTTVVKSGAGMVHAIVINTPVANAVVTQYDNTAASGTKIGTITLPAALLSSGPVTVILNAKFATGYTVVTSGATMDCTAITR